MSSFNVEHKCHLFYTPFPSHLFCVHSKQISITGNIMLSYTYMFTCLLDHQVKDHFSFLYPAIYFSLVCISSSLAQCLVVRRKVYNKCFFSCVQLPLYYYVSPISFCWKLQISFWVFPLIYLHARFAPPNPILSIIKQIYYNNRR